MSDVLWNFYKSYRACVRAKVTALRAAQLEGDERDDLLVVAERRLELAESYERAFGRPTLLVVGGLMGTGKSTVASALSEALGFDCLRTDLVRRDLFGTQLRSEAFGEGDYTAVNRQRVYDELFRRAAARLAVGVSVVLDGTFLAADVLIPARDLAASAGATFLAVRCECPDHLARRRVADRLAAGRDASQARPELFDRQKRERGAVPTDVATIHVDTSSVVSEVLPDVYARLREIDAATPS